MNIFHKCCKKIKLLEHPKDIDTKSMWKHIDGQEIPGYGENSMYEFRVKMWLEEMGNQQQRI